LFCVFLFSLSLSLSLSLYFIRCIRLWTLFQTLNIGLSFKKKKKLTQFNPPSCIFLTFNIGVPMSCDIGKPQCHKQCFKTQTGDRLGQGTGSLVEPVGHWSGRMTIDPVYIKIFMTKNYIMNEILIKKIMSFFFLFTVRTLKKIIFTASSLQVNFLTAAQFKLIPIPIQISSYIYSIKNLTHK